MTAVLLPLGAGFLYAASALLVKRSAELGVGVWRTAFVANVMCGLVFLPLLLLGGQVHLQLWYQPLLVAACFVIGQWLTFLSFEIGDVSIATPVLGLKIVLVALLVTWIERVALSWQIWTAAVLATGGIALLNSAGSSGTHRNVGRTILMSGLAAASYAFFDVLVQRCSPAWGPGRFLPITMTLSALLSLAFAPRFRAPLLALPRPTWRWLLAGTFVLGVQSMMFVTTVAHWGEAAIANVAYSSRGLWSILLIWLFGHWVRSREQHLERRVLLGRLLGALLMMSAIALVLA